MNNYLFKSICIIKFNIYIYKLITFWHDHWYYKLKSFYTDHLYAAKRRILLFKTEDFNKHCNSVLFLIKNVLFCFYVVKTTVTHFFYYNILQSVKLRWFDNIAKKIHIREPAITVPKRKIHRILVVDMCFLSLNRFVL